MLVAKFGNIAVKKVADPTISEMLHFAVATSAARKAQERESNWQSQALVIPLSKQCLFLHTATQPIAVEWQLETLTHRHMPTGYYHTKDSVQEYIHLAKDVNGRGLIEKLHAYLPADSSVLELGTGPGTDWKILSETYSVVGSDLSKEFLAHLSASNPAGKFLELDASTLSVDESFDGIYANKVLHHLNDDELRASVARQHAILNPGGIVCHSFWKGEGSEVFKGMFVNYHVADTLNAFFTEHFEVLLLEPYNEFEADDSLLLIARKK